MEEKCNCEACGELNNEVKKSSAKEIASMERILFALAQRKPTVTEEDKELAKGKTAIVGKELREDLILDSIGARVVRLPLMEILLFSGKGRLPTWQERQEVTSG